MIAVKATQLSLLVLLYLEACWEWCLSYAAVQGVKVVGVGVGGIMGAMVEVDIVVVVLVVEVVGVMVAVAVAVVEVVVAVEENAKIHFGRFQDVIRHILTGQLSWSVVCVVPELRADEHPGAEGFLHS